MKYLLTILLLAIFFTGCEKEYNAPVPDTGGWAPFEQAPAVPLNAVTRNAMEGVYTLTDGVDDFGSLAAIKWSFIHNGNDTTFHVSGFFGKDISYFICKGRRSGDSILLNGYWRKMTSTETGVIRLVIPAGEGASLLLGPGPVVSAGDIIIRGMFGAGSGDLKIPIRLIYERKLNNTPAFKIMAHRSGGRSSDLLPVSENSVEMILKTSEFGSTGIEVDVRFTKDRVPVLYHDNTLNLRAIQKSGLVGSIEDYSFDQLSTFVRLIHGEKIPTLRQALDAILYQTQLTFVWLDSKFDDNIEVIRALQKEYLSKASAAGRTLQIVIGIPGEKQFQQFLSLPDYKNTPSLCELSTEKATESNALVWAPRFTEGIQKEKTAQMHAQGRQVFVWTLDVPEFITKFINEGDFDAILSNYPSCVAFNYYVRQP